MNLLPVNYVLTVRNSNWVSFVSTVHILKYPVVEKTLQPAQHHMGRVKRIWYLLPLRAAKVQASLRIHAVSPELPLLDHTSSESRGTFRQKTSSLALLNGWTCAVKMCHDGMFEDTNSLDAPHM